MPRLKRASYRNAQGRITYYYPNCQRCGKLKGRTRSKLCNSCGHYKPKNGLVALLCPSCGDVLERDELILSLYWAGCGSTILSKVFGITPTRIMQIVRARGISIGKQYHQKHTEKVESQIRE